MTGHELIIAMRRMGKKPTVVWVNDYPEAMGDNNVILAGDDIPEMLDLRFLIGTTAVCASPNKARLARIAKACIEAKAKRVITSLHVEFIKTRFEVIEMTDTEGHMVWPN